MFMGVKGIFEKPEQKKAKWYKMSVYAGGMRFFLRNLGENGVNREICEKEGEPLVDADWR